MSVGTIKPIQLTLFQIEPIFSKVILDWLFNYLNIKKVFRPIDRLEEIVEAFGKIPRTPNGNIDYYRCAQLLCEKDGGRLPTKEELAKLASYIYGEKITVENSYREGLTVKNIPEVLKPIWDKYGWLFLWASSEGSGYDNNVEGWSLDADTTSLDSTSRNYPYPQVVCVGS